MLPVLHVLSLSSWAVHDFDGKNNQPQEILWEGSEFYIVGGAINILNTVYPSGIEIWHHSSYNRMCHWWECFEDFLILVVQLEIELNEQSGTCTKR